MSLINQMLRDLERRQSSVGVADGSITADLGSVDTGLREHSTGLRWFAIPMLLGVAVVSAAYFAPFPRGLVSGAVEFEDVATGLGQPASRRGSPAQRKFGAGESPTRETRLRFDNSLTLPARREVASLELAPELAAEVEHINSVLATNPPAAIPDSGRETPVPALERSNPFESPPGRRPAPADEQPLERVALAATPADRAESLYRKAVTLIRSGDPGGGEVLLRQALATWSGHAKAREVLAARLVARRQLDEAITLLETGLASDAGQPALAKLHARILAEQGRNAEALGILKRSASSAQDDPEYHAFQAALLQRLERHDDAVTAYQQALTKKPDTGLWWMGLAISLEAMGRAGDAADAYRRARRSGGLTGEVKRFVEGRLAKLDG